MVALLTTWAHAYATYYGVASDRHTFTGYVERAT